MNFTPPDSPQPHTVRFISLAAILIITWGLAFNMVDVAVRDVSPMWLVFIRCLIATLVISSWAFYRGHRLPPINDVRWIWYLGLGLIGMFIPFYMISLGQVRIESGLAAIIVSAMPLITIVLAHFFAGERLTARKLLGFGIGFLGIIILFLPDTLSLSLIKAWPSQLLMLFAAACYAVTTILAKRAPDTPSSLGAAIMVLGASIGSGLGAWAGEPLSASIPSLAWGMIVLLGIGSTGIATILYLYVVDTYGPSAMAKINYFPPVVSVIGGILFLGEPFRWRLVIAFAIIAAGVYIASSSRTPER